jgi:hypothetical protein
MEEQYAGRHTAMTSPRLTPERRRALKLLASDRHGVNKDLLVLGHGFKRQMPAALLATGLAAAEHEVVKTGSKTIEITRIKITAAGRQAIEG